MNNTDPQHNRFRALADLIALNSSHVIAHHVLTKWAETYEREGHPELVEKWKRRTAKTYEMIQSLYARFPTLKTDYAEWKTRRGRTRLMDRLESEGIEIVLVDWWQAEDDAEPRTEPVADIVRDLVNAMRMRGNT